MYFSCWLLFFFIAQSKSFFFFFSFFTTCICHSVDLGHTFAPCVLQETFCWRRQRSTAACCCRSSAAAQSKLMPTSLAVASWRTSLACFPVSWLSTSVGETAHSEWKTLLTYDSVNVIRDDCSRNQNTADTNHVAAVPLLTAKSFRDRKSRQRDD